MKAAVECALEVLLELGDRPDYAAVKTLSAPGQARHPRLHIGDPDLDCYDRLLTGGAP